MIMPALLGYWDSELRQHLTLPQVSPRSYRTIRSDQGVYGWRRSIRKIWRDTGALFCWL